MWDQMLSGIAGAAARKSHSRALLDALSQSEEATFRTELLGRALDRWADFSPTDASELLSVKPFEKFEKEFKDFLASKISSN